MLVHRYRLFPPDSDVRGIARRLFEQVQTLPIVSPHGHTQAAWFAGTILFRTQHSFSSNPTTTFSECFTAREFRWRNWRSAYGTEGSGERLANLRQPLLSVPRNADAPVAGFCFQELFGLESGLSEKPPIVLRYDFEKLRTPEFLPRALYERFNLEVLATTDSPLDSLADTRPFENRTGRRGFCQLSAPTRL